MSPKKTIDLQSASAQTRQQSTPEQSRTAKEIRLRLLDDDVPSELNPIWPLWSSPQTEDDWDGAYNRLTQVIKHARAIAAAQHALAWYYDRNGLTGVAPDSEALADLGIKTGDEALYLAERLYHAAVLWRERLLDLAIPNREELGPIQEVKAIEAIQAACREKEQAR